MFFVFRAILFTLNRISRETPTHPAPATTLTFDVNMSRSSAWFCALCFCHMIGCAGVLVFLLKSFYFMCGCVHARSRDLTSFPFLFSLSFFSLMQNFMHFILFFYAFLLFSISPSSLMGFFKWKKKNPKTTTMASLFAVTMIQTRLLSSPWLFLSYLHLLGTALELDPRGSSFCFLNLRFKKLPAEARQMSLPLTLLCVAGVSLEFALKMSPLFLSCLYFFSLCLGGCWLFLLPL